MKVLLVFPRSGSVSAFVPEDFFVRFYTFQGPQKNYVKQNNPLDMLTIFITLFLKRQGKQKNNE